MLTLAFGTPKLTSNVKFILARAKIPSIPEMVFVRANVLLRAMVQRNRSLVQPPLEILNE